ncbi:MAG: sugar transferase [Limnochordia bacterium]
MYRLFFKRLLDLGVAIIVLPFWVVILTVLSPIIYFEDRGPVFYNSLRLGKDGKTFLMYKFRSMKVDAPDIRNEDGSTYNAPDESEVNQDR